MSMQPSLPDEDDTRVSRREFFTGAGSMAGAVAALGALGGLGVAPRAEAALKQRKYYSTYVALELGGQYAGVVEHARGGEPVLSWAPSASNRVITSVRYEPIEMRLADMSAATYAWIADATSRGPTTQHGAIVAANLTLQETYRLHFRDARIIDLSLDALDAERQEIARFNLAIAPATSSHSLELVGKPYAIKSLKASALMAANFRLYIEGLEDASTRAVSIEKVGLRGPQVADAGGTLRTTTGPLSPLPLRFQLPFQFAGPMYQWMQQTLTGNPVFRQGELQLLDRTLTRVIASFSFTQLAMVSVSYPAQGSNDTQLVEVECLPATITLKPGELVK